MTRIVAVNGSPSHPSRSRTLAAHVLDQLGGGDILDLADLDPGALLALGSDPAVDGPADAVAAADILVVATPVYRATYTALTKTIFDLLPQGGVGRRPVVIPLATGYGADHRLAIDHGLRPLVAAEGWTTPTGIYATKADIADDGTISEQVLAAARAAADEARTLSAAVA